VTSEATPDNVKPEDEHHVSPKPEGSEHIVERGAHGFVTKHTKEGADTALSPKAAALLVSVEKYILPLAFAFFAGQHFRYVTSQTLAYRALAGRYAIDSHTHDLFFADVTKHVLLFTLMIFSSITLLFNRPPATLPDKLKHVTLPLAVSYYPVLYGGLDSCTAWLRANWMPAGWRFPAALAGLIFSIAGYSISIWALVYLRRSFALFVSVREVVLKGPYRYVRHPIYLGYLLDVAGLSLAASSVGMIALGAGFAALLVCRARLEEEKLIEADPAYQSYLAQTGFLFPRPGLGKSHPSKAPIHPCGP
jgi:protein-S-isoprenylcysteine O-methyltransferase Ste14